MAKILADHEIRKILGKIIINADEKFINPNGIELRLGSKVRFHSTGEEKELNNGDFLKVNPGESIVICSLESIDFSVDSVSRLFPNSMLMGFITPTTTMMREGISEVATKIDAGFKGLLNWGLRNSSTKELILEYGEPIFKLTIFRLEDAELPELSYGDRKSDSYQDSIGIVRSKRKIPADIPKKKIIASSFDKLDPKKQLREAGYPFDHIGTELIELHGKFETVSKDVALLKNEIKAQTKQLSEKIGNETSAISTRLDDFRDVVLEKVDTVFENKFTRIVGILIGAISIMYASVSFLKAESFDDTTIGFIALIVGAAVFTIIYFIGRKDR